MSTVEIKYCRMPNRSYLKLCSVSSVNIVRATWARHSSLFSHKNRIQFPMKANGDRVGAHMRTSRVRKVPRFSSLESSEARGLAQALSRRSDSLDLIYHNIAGTQAIGAGYQNISILCNTCRHLPARGLDAEVGRIG